MERVGEVTAVRGNMLEITFCRPADCGKCHACSGNQAQMQLLLPGKAEVGDAAVVDMPTGTVMKASAMAYMLPLAGLLGGAALGGVCFGGDIAIALCGLVGLGLSLTVVAITEKKRRSDPAWQPVLRQILPKLELTASQPDDEKGESL